MSAADPDAAGSNSAVRYSVLQPTTAPFTINPTTGQSLDLYTLSTDIYIHMSVHLQVPLPPPIPWTMRLRPSTPLECRPVTVAHLFFVATVPFASMLATSMMRHLYLTRPATPLTSASRWDGLERIWCNQWPQTETPVAMQIWSTHLVAVLLPSSLWLGVPVV